MGHVRRASTACLLTILPSTVGAIAAHAQGEESGLAFTPRVAYVFDNTSQLDTGEGEANAELNDPRFNVFRDAIIADLGPTAVVTRLNNTQGGHSTGQYNFPMYGGAVSFNWPGNENLGITASALYGTYESSRTSLSHNTVRIQFAGVTADTVETVDNVHRAEFARTDLELTAQLRINETFAVMGGVRYERNEIDSTTHTEQRFDSNYSNLKQLVSGGTSIDLSTELATLDYGTTSTDHTLSGRLGAAAYADVGDSQRAYVNGLVHVTTTPESSYTISGTSTQGGVTSPFSNPSQRTRFSYVGLDFAVGYQFNLNDRAVLDLRYRSTFFYPIEGLNQFNDARVNHGLVAGISVWL